MKGESKNKKVLTPDALVYIRQDAKTQLRIASDMNRAVNTVNNWCYNSPEKFTAPAALRIIAKAMGKKVKDIVMEVEPEKTEA